MRLVVIAVLSAFTTYDCLRAEAASSHRTELSLPATPSESDVTANRSSGLITQHLPIVLNDPRRRAKPSKSPERSLQRRTVFRRRRDKVPEHVVDFLKALIYRHPSSTWLDVKTVEPNAVSGNLWGRGKDDYLPPKNRWRIPYADASPLYDSGGSGVFLPHRTLRSISPWGKRDC